MPQLTSHRAIASRSSVNVAHTPTGFSSRSGGIATKISLAPISIPPALGSRSGRSSRHIPLRLRPRLPLLAFALSSASGACFSCSDIYLTLSTQATAKSRKWKYSFKRNQPGVLPQTVTTVWRTELGTTLLIGFNSTTVLSAYFRYLGIHQCPATAAMRQVPLQYGLAMRALGFSGSGHFHLTSILRQKLAAK